MGGFQAFRTIRQTSRLLGPRAAVLAASVIGGFYPADRRGGAVCRNLAGLLGGAPLQHRAKARAVFRHFACYLAEFFTMDRLSSPDVAVDGLDHLEEARRGGRGVIVLTAHLGNWELGAVLLGRMGYPVSAVALPHADARMDALFARQRMRCGIQAIALGSAAREALRFLKQGGLLGLLGDRDFTGDGWQFPLGSGKVRIARGPAVLSARSGAPLLPAVLIREGLWRFRLRFFPPVWPQTDSREAAIRQAAQRSMEPLFESIAKHAEQWIMFDDVILA